MKSSSCRDFEVFDFDEDEEVQEQLAGKYSAKFKNPSSDGLAVLTPNSLECVAPSTGVQTAEIASVDADAIDCDPSRAYATSHASLDKAEETVVSMDECFNDALQAKPSSPEKCMEFRLADHVSQSFISEAEKRCSDLNCSSLVQMQLNCDNLDSPSSSEPIDVTSDVDESMSKSSSLSSPASGMPEDNDMLNDYSMDHCSGDVEMDDMNMAVVLYPDYVVYGDRYCTGPRLTFSNSCIKITGSTAYENQEAFDFEWGINDLVKIECQWFQRVETVMIKLRVISKDAADDDGSLHTSGIEELKVFVVESNWSEKQQNIASLHPTYLATWDCMQDSDMIMGTDGDDSPRQGHYFPVFEESFEEVIYPKGDIDAVSISKRDVDLLQPETFINDTIIDFYINYLKNQIQPEERRRFHFFNSFFFRKLADLDKDPSSASDGKAAFQRVRKWTRKVDLFGKEFVFIPINFSLHWSLIVICHPGEVATFKDEDLNKSAKVPCILHMDSIKGNHAGLKHLIQSYLWEEWKERQKETSEEVSSRFLNLRFVPLELPQQENSFDCGLFLLHYLESFLAEVPVNFSPFKIEKSSNFLNSNWFPPTEASLKRALIQRLISELLQNRSEEAPSSPSSDEDQIVGSKDNGVGSEFHSARFNPGPSCQQNNISSSQSGQGIELTLLSASSMRNSQCVNDSGLVLRDLFNPGTSAGSLVEQCQSFDQKSSYHRLDGAISHLGEDPDTGEQFMFGEAGFNQQQLTGMASQTCSIPYLSKDYSGKTFNMGISLQAERRDIDCSSEPSICDSDDSSDVAITEPFPVAEHSNPRPKERIGERRSHSPSLEKFECAEEGLVSASHELPEKSSVPLENFKCNIEGLVSASHKPPDTPATVEASQNHDMMQSGNENGFQIPSLEYPDVSVSQDSVVADNGIGIHDAQMVENSLVDSNSPGQQPVDNKIGSDHDVQIVKDGLVVLNSSGQQIADNGQHSADNVICLSDNVQIVDDGLAGPDSPTQQQAHNEIDLGGSVQIVDDGLAGESQMVDGGLVGPESPEQQQADNGIDFGGNLQIVNDGLSGKSQMVDDKLAGPESLGKQLADNGIGFGGHDRSVVPELPGQQPIDNGIGLGGDVEIMDHGLAGESRMVDDGLLGSDSPRQQLADNGIGLCVNLQTVDDGLDVQDSGQQPANNVIGPVDDVQMTDNGLVPHSPSQHPAKRPRLSPSLEDDTNVTGSLARDSQS